MMYCNIGLSFRETVPLISGAMVLNKKKKSGLTKSNFEWFAREGYKEKRPDELSRAISKIEL